MTLWQNILLEVAIFTIRLEVPSAWCLAPPQHYTLYAIVFFPSLRYFVAAISCYYFRRSTSEHQDTGSFFFDIKVLNFCFRNVRFCSCLGDWVWTELDLRATGVKVTGARFARQHIQALFHSLFKLDLWTSTQ